MLAPFLLAFQNAEYGPVFRAAFPEAKAKAVAAAVVKDGRTVWSGAEGFLDAEGKKPAKPNSPFRIASLTKAFTATIVLQLVREGKVGLDDPIGDRLSGLPETWRPATVRQLLNHTSGIPSYTDLPDFAKRLEAHQTPAEIVAQTADKPLDFTPGSQYRYNNTAYVVLGMLVEKLDGRPFGQSLASRILKPLGMKETRFDIGGPQPVSEGFDGAGKPSLRFNMSLPYAAGSIVSTANDMAKWLAAQGSPRLLPESLWAEAWKSGQLPDGKPTQYGLGWSLSKMNDVPTVQHGGGIPGFTTFVRRVPSRNVAVVVLTNSEGASPETVADRLLEAADPTLKSPDATITDPDPKVTAAAEKLFLGLLRGEPDRSLMSEGLSKAITPEAVERGRGFFANLGAYQRMRLVKAEGGARTYVVELEKGKIRLGTAVDAAGRFTGFAVRPA